MKNNPIFSSWLKETNVGIEIQRKPHSKTQLQIAFEAGQTYEKQRGIYAHLPHVFEMVGWVKSPMGNVILPRPLTDTDQPVFKRIPNPNYKGIRDEQTNSDYTPST